MSYSRKFFIYPLFFLLLISLFLWGFSFVINPNKISTFVSEKLQDVSSLPTEITGKISWQFLPQPRIKIKGIHIGDKKQINSNELVVDNLFLNVKLMPLLSGKVVFNDINIDGFSLQVYPENKVVDLAKNQEKTSPNSAESQAINIDRLFLNRGNIIVHYKDHELLLSNLRLEAKQVNLQHQSFPLQLKSTLQITKANQTKAKTSLQFKGSLALSKHIFAQLNTPHSPILNGQLILLNTQTPLLNLKRVSATILLNQGVLAFNPVSMSLYEGESVGDFSYHLMDKIIKINQTATHLNSGKLTADLFKKRLLKGPIDISIHGTADLGEIDWLRTLTGNGHFSMREGNIESLNLNKIIETTSEQINDRLGGKQSKTSPALHLDSFLSPDVAKGITPFKLFTVEFHLANNYLYADSLFLQTDRLRLKGDGRLNLNTYEINNYLLATILSNHKKVEQIQSMLGGAFPFQLQGNLFQPKLIPDLKKINPVLTKLWLSTTLSRPVKKFKDQLITILHP